MPIATPSPLSRPVLRRVHLSHHSSRHAILRSSKSSYFLAGGCGCFVGGILRYLLTLLLPGAADGRFPWSTFAANALGCLLIGLLSGWLSRTAAPDTLRLFLTVGLCGGFTTFSTFVADGRALWQQQLTLTAVAYLCSSLIVGFALLLLGHRLAA